MRIFLCYVNNPFDNIILTTHASRGAALPTEDPKRVHKTLQLVILRTSNRSLRCRDLLHPGQKDLWKSLLAHTQHHQWLRKLKKKTKGTLSIQNCITEVNQRQVDSLQNLHLSHPAHGRHISLSHQFQSQHRISHMECGSLGNLMDLGHHPHPVPRDNGQKDQFEVVKQDHVDWIWCQISNEPTWRAYLFSPKDEILARDASPSPTGSGKRVRPQKMCRLEEKQ